RLFQLLQKCPDDVFVLLNAGSGSENELAVGGVAPGIGENAGSQIPFRRGKIGIPDRPGVDASLGKGRPGVRRGEVDGPDVLVFQPFLLQRLQQQIMHIGALVEGHFFPRRSLTLRMGESAGTTIASFSGLGIPEAMYKRGVFAAWAKIGGVLPVCPMSMLPTFIASSSCGPAGKWNHSTRTPRGFRRFSSVPRAFRMLRVPNFW